MSKFYCLDCRKLTKTYMDIFKGFSLCCKKCGSLRLMKLDEMNKEEFNKFVKEFKKRTGKVE